jgi:branched-chain amino acid transport system permease protein
MPPLAIGFDFLAGSEFWLGVATVAGIYAIFVLGLQLNIGQTGILNFGQAGFMAVGAYGMAILVVQLGWSPWLALPVATVIAVLAGLLIGLPSLRLRGDYFAIVTLAAAQIVVVVAQNARGLTGGNNGLSGFTDAWTDVQRSILDALEPIGLGDQYSLPLFGVTWVLFLVLLALVLGLQRTPWGRVLRAIREDEDAAAALGKNVLAYKLQSLGLAAAFGAVAGYLLALNISLVYPSSFDADFTFIGMAILILGGLGSYVGVALGAVLLWAVLEAARFVELPLSSDRVAALRLLLVGLVLIAIAMFRPQGILGRREEMVLRD